MSLVPVAIGALGGIFLGFLIGEPAGLLEPIGQLYILLLQVAVYPYIICSLLHGLGSMLPGQAWKLLKVGWPFYVGLWVLVFGVLFVLTRAVPTPDAVSWIPGTEKFSMNSLLELLIPSNPFAALTSNAMPAVILFAIFYGVAIQHVREKQSLLDALSAIAQASLTFWRAVVKMVPVAVFALFASTFGTVSFAELERIGYFLILFYVGAALVVLWLVPVCLQYLLPLRYRDIITSLRDALMIGLVTTISVAAVPFIVDATRRLAEAQGVRDKELDDVIRTNISVAYPLGQLGNFFVYLFVFFGAFLYGVRIPPTKDLLLPFVSLLSCFGSPTSSIVSAKFLSDWLQLGPDAEPLFVELMVILRYGMVTASIMGFAFLSFTVVLAYYGKLRIRPARLAVALLATIGVLIAGSLGARQLYEKAMESGPSPYADFTLSPELTGAVESKIVSTPDLGSPDNPPSEDALKRIHRSGVLRVGFSPAVVPFSYLNDAGQLVGFDIALAYRLASDMDVRLEFVPFKWPDLVEHLERRDFDIVMAGAYVTSQRLQRIIATEPYYQSLPAFMTPRKRSEEFKDRETINRMKSPRLGVFDDPVLRPRLKLDFPDVDVVTLPDYSTPPDFNEVDGAFWTLVEAEAMAAANPGLIAVATEDVGPPVLFAYLMPPDSPHFRNYVNYWLRLEETAGFRREEEKHWIERLPPTREDERWSILDALFGIRL